MDFTLPKKCAIKMSIEGKENVISQFTVPLCLSHTTFIFPKKRKSQIDNNIVMYVTMW